MWSRSEYAGITTALYIDDFTFDYIGETYGYPARLSASYLAAVACPYLFIDDLVDCGKDTAEEVLDQMRSLAGVISERLTAYAERSGEFAVHFVRGISIFGSRVTESYSMIFNKGDQSGWDAALIEINTALMRSYADRLNTVNSRINDLNSRMDLLYKNTGLRDLNSLLRANVMTGYNRQISNCAKYLLETANDFDTVERDIAFQY